MNPINNRNFKYNIERMNIVAELLGVSMYEPFQIQFYRHKNVYSNAWYRIAPNGLVYSYEKDEKYGYKSDALEGLLTGKHQIIKV